MFLAPLLVYLNITQSQKSESSALRFNMSTLKKLFPPFLVGFLTLAFMNTYAMIPGDLLDGRIQVHYSLAVASKILMMIAMAAIGLMVKVDSLVKLGPKPMIIGLISTVIVSISSLLFIL